MAAVLLDTHAWAWCLTGDPRLSATATRALNDAEAVYVSPISFFEIAQKVRIGKWPEMLPHVADLPALLVQQGGLVATMTPEVCVLGASMEWAHRDLFDRLIAATSLIEGWDLISADTMFDQLAGDPGKVNRVW